MARSAKPRQRSGGGFSKAQQPLYRPLLKKAWQAQARIMGLDQADYDAWYAEQLGTAIGRDISSTTELNQSRDFDRVMAHLEVLAMDGIHWQLKADANAAKIIRYTLGRQFPQATVDLSEDYIRRTARQMLQTEALPRLGRLTDRQFRSLIQALAVHCRRHEG